jgi:hypothetical protein
MPEASATTDCDVVGLDDVELLESVTTLELLDLAARGATGELTCACPAGRVHVYLQRGRVAWASDGGHPHAFTGWLKQHAGVAAEAVESAVASCRTSRQPIGEALVARLVASEEQVRAALRHQIGLALHVGECQRAGHATFTERSYGEYDTRFTFTASEVICEEQEVARACYAASARGARCACGHQG